MPWKFRQLVRGSQMVAAGGTREPLMDEETLVSYVFIQAKKDAADNAGHVFVGDDTLVAGTLESGEMATGDVWEPPLAEGEIIDLNKIYVDADTNDDGVVFLYLPV